MKSKVRTPFFEVGAKNYIYGEDVFSLRRRRTRLGKKYDIDVLFTAPYMWIFAGLQKIRI